MWHLRWISDIRRGNRSAPDDARPLNKTSTGRIVAIAEVGALAANRSDDAFHIRILPGTRRRGDDFGDADASHSALERVAVDAIAVSV